MDDERVHDLTTANRRFLADLLESLDEQQWRTETLCAGWSAQELTAHLVQPSITGFGQVFLVALRYRGDTERTIDHITRRIARRPRAELIGLLREHAPDKLNPPRVGPMGPYVDTCVHLRDLARPLGLEDADVGSEQWELVLDYLLGPRPAPALLGVRSLDRLTLHATDLGRTWGSEGELVQGTAEALAMAVTGRRSALADLDGPGAAVLSQRLRT